MNGGQFLYTFAYNADGIRTVKTNGSMIHHYTLNGSQIVTDDLPMVDALPGNVTATDAATIGISTLGQLWQKRNMIRIHINAKVKKARS